MKPSWGGGFFCSGVGAGEGAEKRVKVFSLQTACS